MNGDEGFTAGSGNIYADLGFDEPEIEMVKATLARQIAALVRVRGLTRLDQDVEIVVQPKASKYAVGQIAVTSPTQSEQT